MLGQKSVGSPPIVLIGLDNRHSLEQEYFKLQIAGFSPCEFIEPYKKMGLTAFALLVDEKDREKFSDYPLL